MGQITYITHDGRHYIVNAIPGISVMQLATSQAIPGIVAECGGSLSCATCHVYVDDAWLDRTGEPKQAEQDMLVFAEVPAHNSRLSCQIRYHDELDGLVVRVPEAQ